jgi:hypothetical protein
MPSPLDRLSAHLLACTLHPNWNNLPEYCAVLDVPGQMDLAHEGQTPNTLLTPVPDRSLADIEGIHEKKKSLNISLSIMFQGQSIWHLKPRHPTFSCPDCSGPWIWHIT